MFHVYIYFVWSSLKMCCSRKEIASLPVKIYWISIWLVIIGFRQFCWFDGICWNFMNPSCTLFIHDDGQPEISIWNVHISICWLIKLYEFFKLKTPLYYFSMEKETGKCVKMLSKLVKRAHIKRSHFIAWEALSL